jgi:hypothetical protein
MAIYFLKDPSEQNHLKELANSVQDRQLTKQPKKKKLQAESTAGTRHVPR